MTSSHVTVKPGVGAIRQSVTTLALVVVRVLRMACRLNEFPLRCVVPPALRVVLWVAITAPLPTLLRQDLLESLDGFMTRVRVTPTAAAAWR